jgi:hypothetical protein
MVSVTPTACLLLALALPAQNAAPKAGQSATGTINADNVKPGTYTGKLLSVPSADGAFSVEITSTVTVPKPNAQQLIAATAKFQTDYQNGLNSIQRDLTNSRSPNDRAYHQRRLGDHLAWYQRNHPHYRPGGSHFPYEAKEVTQVVDFHAAPDLKVRLANPPEVFDDKGKAREYTQAELKKLKGPDPSLPGYEGKKEDLTTGALVKVTLARARTAPRTGKSAAEAPAGPRNVVTTIVLISKDGKPPAPATAKTPAKKQ